jgi:hypothetical protein
VRRVADDPPRPPRPEHALLVADPERDLTLDHEPALLVGMAMGWHDRVGCELDHGERQPLALDATSDDAVPDLNRRELGEVGEVGHRSLRDASRSGRGPTSSQPT